MHQQSLFLIAQEYALPNPSPLEFIVFCFIYLGVIGVLIAGMWATFAKAGKPGWASIIPIYNIIVLLEIGSQPIWLLILYFIPIANIVAVVLTVSGVAKNFGKGGGFAVGLFFLPFIFYPILGFGDARYYPQVVPASFED